MGRIWNESVKFRQAQTASDCTGHHQQTPSAAEHTIVAQYAEDQLVLTPSSITVESLTPTRYQSLSRESNQQPTTRFYLRDADGGFTPLHTIRQVRRRALRTQREYLPSFQPGDLATAHIRQGVHLLSRLVNVELSAAQVSPSSDRERWVVRWAEHIVREWSEQQ